MRRSLLLLAGLLFFTGNVQAGGPLGASGVVPRHYAAASFPLAYKVDQGPLGAFSNATATSIANYAFQQWDNVSSAAVSFTNTGALPRDVTTATDPYISGNTQFNDGVNPVVFDTDGSITDAKLGVGAKASVLGFASSAYIGNTYVEGYAIINGSLSGAGSVSDQDRYRATITHEIGHFLGLGHSQVAMHADFATMYPVIVKTAQQTLDPDDTSAIANLYPAGAYTSSVGSISGTVRNTNNANLSGVNVIAVNTSTGAAYSTLVDYFSGGKGGFDNAPAASGSYTISGLPPGAYYVRIEPVNANFTGGSGVGSYNTPINANISREWYNDGSESGDMLADNTNQQTTVNVNAAATTSGINFIENTSPTLSTLLYHDGTPAVAFTIPQGSVTGYATRFTAPVTGSLVGVRFRLQGNSVLPLTGSLTITVYTNTQGSIAGIPGAALGSVTISFRDLVADQDNEVWLRSIGAPINFIGGNNFHIAFTTNGVGTPVFLTDDGNPTQNRSSYQLSGSTWKNFGDGGYVTGYNLIVSAVYSNAVFGTPTPGITVAPTSLAFGTIRPGVTVDRTLHVTNSGTAALNVANTPILGVDSLDYIVVSGGGTFSLAPGAGRDIVVRFAPKRAGGKEDPSKSARLSIVSNADPSPFDVPLVGNAVQPLATRLDTGIAFGSRLVGATYVIDTVIIHNTCSDTLHISSVVLSGPDAGAFKLLSSAGTAAVPPDAFYRVRIQFTPTERRLYTAMLRVNHDDSTGHTDFSLTGRGIAPVIARSATTLQGGSVHVRKSVPMPPLTITNSGDAPLRITSLGISGDAAGDYTIVNPPSLPLTLGPGASIAVGINFAPQTTGVRTASLDIMADGLPISSVTLVGTGVEGSLSFGSSTIDFGDVVVGSTERRSVTITNTGTDTLTISQTAFNIIGFTVVSGLEPGTKIAPGASITATLQFAPQASGQASGALMVTNDGAQSVAVIGILGRGVQPGLAVSLSSMTFGVVHVGETRLDSFTIRNTGTAPLTLLTLALGGGNADAFTIVAPLLPAIIAPGASRTVVVRLNPQSAEGILAATLEVVALGGATTAINLSATIGQGLVAVTPTVAFTTRPANADYDTLLFVRNVTSSPMTITSIAVQSQKDGTPGNYFQVFNTAPFVIGANDSVDLRVRFHPSAGGGSYSGTITLHSNSQFDSSVTIALNATATQSSGVEREIATGGLVLSMLPVAPNPARDAAMVFYSIRGSGHITLRMQLVDERGAVVRNVGTRELAGEGAEQRLSAPIDLAGLPSGMYHLILRSERGIIARNVMVVR